MVRDLEQYIPWYVTSIAWYVVGRFSRSSLAYMFPKVAENPIPLSLFYVTSAMYHGTRYLSNWFSMPDMGRLFARLLSTINLKYIIGFQVATSTIKRCMPRLTDGVEKEYVMRQVTKHIILPSYRKSLLMLVHSLRCWPNIKPTLDLDRYIQCVNRVSGRR